MKHIALITLLTLFSSCVTTPVLTSQYQTLGYNVNEYSDGYENYYEVFDLSGNLVAQANILGFVNWKRGRLLELISDERTSDADRERYKIEYEDIARRLDIYQNYTLQRNLQTLTPTVQHRQLNLCSSTSKNCFNP